MKKLEIVLVITIVIGIIGNLFLIEYSNHVFMIGCTVLATLYFYLSFVFFNDISVRKMFKKSSYKGVTAKRIIGTIGIGQTLSIIIIGFQFKFLLLPGAHEMLIIGVESLMVISIIAGFIFIKRYKGQSEFYSRIFKRTIPAIIVGALFYWLPTDSLIDIKYRDRPVYSELLKQSIKDPNNEQLRQELEQEREKYLTE